MHVVIVFVLTCVVNIKFVGTLKAKPESEENENNDEQQELTTEANLMLDHTFVALIHIVFTDGSKKTCTGSIIHDNVVITAAHCFLNPQILEETKPLENFQMKIYTNCNFKLEFSTSADLCQEVNCKLEHKPHIRPELTTSFVVIGTKKMFDTDYEQYLPIERVLTHPMYSGWTADLSLVYTFAGMTSDKPGTIIPLAGEKTSTHVDANVTVLSWGRMEISQTNLKESTEEKCDSSCEDCNKSEVQYANNKKKVTAFLRSKIRQRTNLESTPGYNEESKYVKKRDPPPMFETEKTQNRYLQAKFRPRPELFSRYLSMEETETIKPKHHTHRTTKHKPVQDNNEEQAIYEEEILEPKTIQAGSSPPDEALSTEELPMTVEETSEKNNANAVKKQVDALSPELADFNFKSYYRNWRRQMGSQQNQLTVEIFGFVNVQACKKIVEKSMPSRFNITNNNGVVCYSTEDHYISHEDSGAPAVRRGQLVAVTVGGAEVDGDHVAVGMKMSCFCSWIADNIPNGDNHLNCCDNCCDVKHKEVFKDKTYRHKYKYAF